MKKGRKAGLLASFYRIKRILRSLSEDYGGFYCLGLSVLDIDRGWNKGFFQIYVSIARKFAVNLRH